MYFTTAGAYAARLCANAIFQQCLLPTGFFGTTGSFGMTEQVQLRQKLMNTDLQELCGYVSVLANDQSIDWPTTIDEKNVPAKIQTVLNCEVFTIIM